MTGEVLRVTATDAALALIDRLAAKHGPLMFHQSGGCCDGSAPMWYGQGEFIVGTSAACRSTSAGRSSSTGSTRS